MLKQAARVDTVPAWELLGCIGSRAGLTALRERRTCRALVFMASMFRPGAYKFGTAGRMLFIGSLNECAGGLKPVKPKPDTTGCKPYGEEPGAKTLCVGIVFQQAARVDAEPAWEVLGCFGARAGLWDSQWEGRKCRAIAFMASIFSCVTRRGAYKVGTAVDRM